MEIINRGFEPNRVIAICAEASIARWAQEAANNAGLVVMVHGEGNLEQRLAISAWAPADSREINVHLVNAANAASIALLGAKRVVLLRGDPILSPKIHAADLGGTLIHPAGSLVAGHR